MIGKEEQEKVIALVKEAFAKDNDIVIMIRKKNANGNPDKEQVFSFAHATQKALIRFGISILNDQKISPTDYAFLSVLHDMQHVASSAEPFDGGKAE